MALTVSLQDALWLGRVKTLPILWTNLLAGLALAGGELFDIRTLLLFLSLTPLYLGGALLNDAFDAPADADNHPERPIPAGRVKRWTVFALGFGLLALALPPLYIAGTLMDPVEFAGFNAWPLVCGGALAATILLYDWRHRGNPWGPTVLGACRFLVYLTAGFAIMAPAPLPLLIGAAMLFCYSLAQGYIAQLEDKAAIPWPFYLLLAAPLVYGIGLITQRPHMLLFWVGFASAVAFALWLRGRGEANDHARAIIVLTAAVALYDALLIAGVGGLGLAALALIGFAATLLLQLVAPERQIDRSSTDE